MKKELSIGDAWLLLIANLVLIAAMVITIISHAWLLLGLVNAAAWVLLWYTQRQLSDEQKEQVRRFWRR